MCVGTYEFFEGIASRAAFKHLIYTRLNHAARGIDTILIHVRAHAHMHKHMHTHNITHTHINTHAHAHAQNHICTRTCTKLTAEIKQITHKRKQPSKQITHKRNARIHTPVPTYLLMPLLELRLLAVFALIVVCEGLLLALLTALNRFAYDEMGPMRK